MLVYFADLAHTYSTENESLMVPLNIGYLKSYVLKQHKNNVDIKLFKDPNKLLKAFYKKPPDLLGLSNYGWNEDLNLRIGKFIKMEFPKTTIISGGPNMDDKTECRIDFLKKNDHISYYIVDGGEEPFSELITWLKNNKETDIPKNIIYLKKDGELFSSGRRPLKKEANHISSPYLEGYLDEFLDLNMVPLLETNRGCPYRCTFCAWGMASHNIVSRLNIDHALEEIKYIGKRSKVNKWIICDANFGILKRDVEIAKAIRKVHDEYRWPKKLSLWLSKNTTNRNLEIAEILEDMIEPVMAIQSMDQEVLANIKRDNISSDTYFKYQERFHSIGATTTSDIIIPLPGETLETHLKGLRKIFDMGVDNIINHNMRLLPGSELYSPEMRKKYNFKTKYRLIHGDGGYYKTPHGKGVKSFELEESLRSTNTMSEKDVFKLRKIHFLIEFAWNFQVYSDLLKLAKKFQINQLDIILNFLENGKKNKELIKFWKLFDRFSRDEWFNSREEAERFFSDKKNFDDLINQKYEKLNIQFSIIILRDYKITFDKALLQTIKSFNAIPNNIIDDLSKIVFAEFPSLNSGNIKPKPKIDSISNFEISQHHFPKNELRKQIIDILSKKNKSISKILNTQGFSIKDLRLR